MKKEKKEVPMPKLKAKADWKGTLKVTGIVVFVSTCVAVGLLTLVGSNSKPKTEYIEKGVVTNYVCKIVGAEPDENVVAVQCFTK